jgi:ankyrin repeat protein
VKILVEYGADINIQGYYGRSIFHYVVLSCGNAACWEYYFDDVETLRKYFGADIHSSDLEGNTALHNIMKNCSRSTADTRPYEENIIQYLIDDCDTYFLTLKNHDGHTAWDMGHQNQENELYMVLAKK